jgi:hypothetical protein
MRHEVGDCHIAGEDEGDGPREQPDHNENATNQLD